MRYHPRIGYTYMPGAKLRVQGASGGYLLRTNAAGYRSEREFAPARTPGVFRALLFGDSQAAGDGTANTARFSDLIEKAVPGLEIYNYGLSGTGTDQQFLAYEENASVEHDLVIVCVYAENVRRLPSRVLRSQDMSGEFVFRPKPYYELRPEGLELCNVPVPKSAWTEETLPKEMLPHVYAYGVENSVFSNPTGGMASLVRKLTPAGPVRDALKSLAGKLRKVQPLPEYDSASNPSWILLRALLSHWVTVSKVPVMVVPLPHYTALRGEADARNCQARFRELARDTGCIVYDPLPELLTRSVEDRWSYWSVATAHFSVAGHAALAELMAPQIARVMERAK